MSTQIDFSQYRRDKSQEYPVLGQKDYEAPSPTQNNLTSGSVIDFSQYKRKPDHTPLEKAGRLGAQFGIGRVEAATLPYNAAAFASEAAMKSPGVAETVYRQQLFEDIEQMAQQKQTGIWSPEDEAHFQKAQQLIKNPDELRKNIPKDIQGLDTGSLLETAFEKAGIDIKPEGIAENAVRWMGFIKDPRKIAELSKLGVDVLKGPDKWQRYAKAIFPTGKEVVRGLAAGTALELAADNQLGPIGTMSAAIIGDVIGAGLPGAVKGIGKFASSPIKTSKELAAKGLVAATRLSGKEKLELQQDLIREFRNSGIQADIGSITGSNLVKMIQARLAQSGLVGTKLDQFKKGLTKQIVDEYGLLAKGVGNEKFATLYEAGEALKEGIEKGRNLDLSIARNMYKDARDLGKGKFAVLETPELAKKIDKLEQELAPGSVKSPETQKVINELGKLKSDLLDAQGNLKPASVSDLINNKINLNDIIDYEIQGGSKQLLKGIVKDIDNALKEYGRIQDRKFLQAYEGANSRFASHAKTFRNKNISDILKGQDPQSLFNKMNSVQGIRDIKNALSKTEEGRNLFNDLKRAKFDDLVMKNVVDGATNQLKFGKFSNILEKGNNRTVIRELLGSENFPRFERLLKSTGKLAESAQKYFNSSQSATSALDVAFTTKGLFDLASLLAGNPWPFTKTVGTFASARALSHLITDPIFLRTVEEGILAGQKNNTKKLKTLFDSIATPLIDAEKLK